MEKLTPGRPPHPPPVQNLVVVDTRRTNNRATEVKLGKLTNLHDLDGESCCCCHCCGGGGGGVVIVVVVDCCCPLPFHSLLHSASKNSLSRITTACGLAKGLSLDNATWPSPPRPNKPARLHSTTTTQHVVNTLGPYCAVDKYTRKNNMHYGGKTER